MSQGSALGPTLFLILIKDLPLHLHFCDTDNFADDITIHINGKTKLEIEPKLQHDGEKSNTKQHKMRIHFDKTNCMAIGTKHKTRNASNLNVKIENNKIKQVEKQKLLGVFIDENLLWTAHIDYLCANISSKVSLLKLLSSYVPIEVQKLFCQGYILSQIDYYQIPGVR